MNTPKYLLIITALLTILTIPVFTFAQEAENTDTEDVDRELIRQKLKERLEGVEEEDATVSAKLNDEETSDAKYYAYYGIIEEATGSSMLIKTREDITKKVSIADDAELSLFTTRTKEIEVEDIEKGMFVIAMGTMGNNKTLNATRISVSEPDEDIVTKQVIHGKITEVDSDTITLHNDHDVQIEIPKTYKLQIQGVEDPEEDDVSINDKAVAIVEAETDDDGEITYTLISIYISPSINNPLAETNQIIEETPLDEATDSADTEDAEDAEDVEE